MPTRPTLYLLASPETAPSVLFGLLDVLSTTGVAFKELVAGQPGNPLLDVRIASRGAEPFRCVWNVLVEPDAEIASIEHADAVVVCDMYVPVTESPRNRYPAEVRFIRRMHAAGALIASVCSGSLVLADTGLLDGYESASHWAYRDLYREHFPKVTLRREDILTVGGDDRRIITAGGVSAWQDLALYLIARLCGQAHAVEVAKVHLISTHDDGQLPYAAMGASRASPDGVIAKCQAWVAQNYAVTNPVARMAEHAGLNSRTFARRFQSATGYSPMEYVHTLRIEEAKQYLEVDDHPIEAVGVTVGYEDVAYFRRLFKRLTGLTPARYRRKYTRMLPAAHVATDRHVG